MVVADAGWAQFLQVSLAKVDAAHYQMLYTGQKTQVQIISTFTKLHNVVKDRHKSSYGGTAMCKLWSPTACQRVGHFPVQRLEYGCVSLEFADQQQ